MRKIRIDPDLYEAELLICPMRCRPARYPFDRKHWIFEVKWDGYRAIADLDGSGNVDLYSRNGASFKRRFPEIIDDLSDLKSPALLGGEIVALDETGKSRFEWLVKRGTLVYYVFDLLFLDGQDLRPLPLIKRKSQLKRLLKRSPPRLLYLDHVTEQGLTCFAWVKELGHEGIVAKDSKSPYVEGPTRTWHWQDIKNQNFKRKQPRQMKVPR
jgi:bifunctional non-homologous end joining protein LigD